MKQNRYNIIIAITALIISSCGITKEYSRPDGAASDNLYRIEPPTAQTAKTVKIDPTNSITEYAWRSYFQDQLLKEHIETALTNNNSYRLAAQQVLKAEARLKQSKAGYIPTLSANMIAGKTWQDGDDIKSYGLTGNLSWEADIWGKIKSGVDASIVAGEITAVEYAGVRATLIADVAKLYLQLMTMDKQLEITLSNSAFMAEQITTLEALKEAGMVNQVSIDQAKAQLYLVDGQLEQQRQGINALENTLAILMGIPSQTIERNSLDNFTMEESYGTGVPASLLEHRPDVKSAELAMVQTLELTNVAKTQFYPSFTISASGGSEALKLSSWLTPESILFNLVGGLTQPILNKRAIKTEYELAQLAQQDALIMFEQSLLVAGKEVSDALFLIQSIDKQSKLQQQNLEANKQAVIHSKELLNYGEINYLELLVAQQNALTSELSVAMLQSQFYTARIDLYRALGGGVE